MVRFYVATEHPESPPSGAEHGQTHIFHAKVKTWKHKNQSRAKPPSPQRKHKTNNIKYLASLRLGVRIDFGVFVTYDYSISTDPLERIDKKSKTMKCIVDPRNGTVC